MKINFVIPFVSRSGAIRVIFEYANRLTELGHDVTVYYPFWPFNYRGEINIIKIINLGKRFLKKFIDLVIKKDTDAVLFKKTKFNIKQVTFIHDIFLEDADVIITYFLPAALKIASLKKSKGVKIYFVQANESSFISEEKWVRKSFLPLFRYICVSNYSKNIIKQKYGFDSEVILNGVNSDTFYNHNKNFNKDIVNISFINSSNKIKRVENIISAIGRLKNEFQNINFISFGENDSSNLPDYIEYYQNPDDEKIRDIYCNSDIFILASREEACPLAPAEAMACMCALVSTPVGGVVEYTVENESALYIKFDSSDSIYNAVAMLIKDNKLRKKLSLAGYYSVREKLNWIKATERFEKFIKQNVDR